MSQLVSRAAFPARSLLMFSSLCVFVMASSAGHEAAAQVAPVASPAAAAQPARTPSETVREFYKAMRERRFREAFALSIYKPAIEGLTAEEFEELRPEFEKIAAAVPEGIEISGEQISGDSAAVFARVAGDNPVGPPEEIKLIRASGGWIFGDRESQQIVLREGKGFFPNARIKTHHEEVQSLLLKIANAEAVYAARHGGAFADLPTLVQSQPGLREEMNAASTLGYAFRVTLGKDGRSYTVNAEPSRYGRTGLLSFHMDPTGIQSKDTGGKPYNPPPVKKK